MRGTSLNISKHESQQPKRNRGGEKKVMKKSLSLALATAMVASMFSSVALADETSLDAQAKFEALKAEGIFTGYQDGSAGLDKEMTRAEFAAVIVRLLDLDPVTGSSSYTDVADHWGQQQGYIEAVTRAGIMEGTWDGIFDPEGKVTKEQLATIMVRALNLQVDADAEVEGNVTDWAVGYVAAALEAGLIPNDTDFTTNATREILVSSTYTANELKPSQNGLVGISQLTASGAHKLTAQLTSATTEDVEVEVKRNGTTISNFEVELTNNNRSLDIVLENKIVEGEYTVTLSGISNLDEDKATATVKTENEKVTKIDFLTASDTLAQAKVRVQFVALNQYGEDTGMNANSFRIRSNMDEDHYRVVSGEAAVELELDASTDNRRYEYDRNFRVNISITHEETGISATKTFTVGDPQIVSKIEVGELLDKSGKVVDSVDNGELAYFQIAAYDQYGVRVIDQDTLTDYISAITSDRDIEVGDREGNDDLTFEDDIDNDNYQDFRFFVGEEVTAGEYSITMYASGGSATKTFSVGAPSKPASIEFGVSSLNLAENDGLATDSSLASYKKYVPIIMKNAAGEELTPDEIAAAAANDELRVDVIGSAFDVARDEAGRIAEGFVLTGNYKGQIQLDRINRKGSATISISLKDKPEVKASQTFYVGDPREPEKVRLTRNDFDEALFINGVSGKGTFTPVFSDQYGDEAKDPNFFSNPDALDIDKYYAARVTLTKTSGSGTATIKGVRKVNGENDTTFDYVKMTDDNTSGSSEIQENKTYLMKLEDLSGRNMEITATGLANNATGTWRVQVELVELSDSANVANAAISDWARIDQVTKTFEVTADTSKSYSYETYAKFATKDGNVALVQDVSSYLNNVTEARDGGYTKAGQELGVRAVRAGKAVAIPDVIQSVYSDNTRAINGYALSNGKAYVFAFDDVAANVTVTFKDIKGNTQSGNVAFQGVDAPLSVSDITVKRTARTIDRSVVTAGRQGGSNVYVLAPKIFSEALFGDIAVKDSKFGNTFRSSELNNPANPNDLDKYGPNDLNLLNVRYIVSENDAGDDTISVGYDGTVTITDGGNGQIDLGSYTITVAGYGKSIDLQLGVEDLF